MNFTAEEILTDVQTNRVEVIRIAELIDLCKPYNLTEAYNRGDICEIDSTRSTANKYGYSSVAHFPVDVKPYQVYILSMFDKHTRTHPQASYLSGDSATRLSSAAPTPFENYYNKLSDKDKKLLTTKYLHTKLRQEAVESNRESESKDIKLDLFSFTLFQNYLNSQLPKGISSVNAISYIDKVRNIGRDSNEDNKEIRSKYMCAIYDNVKKPSIKLVNALTPYSDSYDVGSYPSAISYYHSYNHNHTDKPSSRTSIAFGINWYQSTLKQLNIPTGNEIRDTQVSSFYQHVVGIKKPNPLNSSEINVVIDMIAILSYFIVKHSSNHAQLMIDHLKAELNDTDRYSTERIKELATEKIQVTNNYSSSIKDIHESI